MNKATFTALEKVFAAEIEGRLPFQSHAAIYRRLMDDGLVEYVKETLPGRFPVIVSGWNLTHRGRMAFGNACPAEQHTGEQK